MICPLITLMLQIQKFFSAKSAKSAGNLVQHAKKTSSFYF